MPLDMTKSNDLQAQYDAQQKRLDDAQKAISDAQQRAKSGAYTAQDQADYRNSGGGNPFGYTGGLDKYVVEKAKGAESATEASVRDEQNRIKSLMDEESQRQSAIKPFTDLQDTQAMRAKQFRTAFPSILDSQLGTERTNMRRNIAEGVGTARAGYNQRGLLYSGLRSGAEADVSKNAEADLAQKSSDITNQLQGEQAQLDQDVANTGFNIADVSKDLSSTSEDYRKSLIDSLLKQDQSRQEVLGGLLGTGAKLAGLGLGAAVK